MKDVLREYSMVVDKFVRHHARFLGAVMVTKMWWTWILLVLLALQVPTRALAQDEVSSELLGNLIMKALKELDKVAYVRFASVYRSFEDIREFGEEIARLGD